jgi:tetratricopeptide (TPR) repeat protein
VNRLHRELLIRVIAPIISCSLLGSGRAQAGDAEVAEADTLFREGRALLAEGDYLRACTKFSKSQRLDPAPGTAINLADCQEKLGKLADALAAARQAMRLLQPGDDREPRIREQVRRLEARVPRLAIKWNAPPREAKRVFLDGSELSDEALGVAREVNPGVHQVLVEHSDEKEDEHEVTVALGESRVFVIDATGSAAESQVPAASPVAQTEPAPTNDSSRRTLAYVVGGVGLVGIAAGIGFSLAAASEKSDAERLEAQIGPSPSACNDANRQGCAELKSAWQTYDRDRNIATGAFVLGGIGVIAAVVLLITDSGGSSDASLRTTVDVGNGGAAMAFRGHF